MTRWTGRGGNAKWPWRARTVIGSCLARRLSADENRVTIVGQDLAERFAIYILGTYRSILKTAYASPPAMMPNRLEAAPIRFSWFAISTDPSTDAVTATTV